ncbi:hypothetical protein HPB52_014743 [Rhipicephalus sanguineus]|uniref:Uncharacterized protein n=1 Tax=Rhipicephalus sanguineus TaxID=34632 RepID=A0A9D4PJL7_RHISA|nr:hypothetical protein HPB52_014743 [Rhipicephalus sanguineus]
MKMEVTLSPERRVEDLRKRLKYPLNVVKLDLTNCILLSPDDLNEQIGLCRSLETLRCVGCALRVIDLHTLLLRNLWSLEIVEFSILSEADETEAELQRLKTAQSHAFSKVKTVYVEVGGEHNFQLLSAILRVCPLLDDLHVHFVRGRFWIADLQCHDIFAKCPPSLAMFTFTSEEPVSCQDERFRSCIAVCGNTRYRRRNFWNCVTLRNLMFPRAVHLPSELTVVAVDFDEGKPTAEWFREAIAANVWVSVFSLCLLLFPADTTGVVYPTVGGLYRASLRDFFSKAMRHVRELNINSFHFGSDLHLAHLLQQGSLPALQSLSASPCGIRRPSVLRWLAHHCPLFVDLDVRIDRRGRLQSCPVCDSAFQADDAEFMSEFSDGPRPLFQRGLSRLTLTGLRLYGCLWFIESCKPTTTVRLCDSTSPSDLNYELLVDVLATSGALRCLVLQAESLDFTVPSLLDNLSGLACLEYLYLLSSAPLFDDVAETSVRALTTRLRRLLCLHAHHRRNDGTDHRITRLRTVEPLTGGPCIGCCSTATFIGHPKPLNRGIV